MSGKVYFHIFNGHKYCVVQSDNTVALEKVNDDPTPNTKAMWEVVRDRNGNYTFKNRSSGGFIVLDNNQITTSSSTGDNSKWLIDPAMNLSIDECRIVKSSTGQVQNAFANNDKKLAIAVKKTTGDVTQQADQLFKVVYAGGEN